MNKLVFVSNHRHIVHLSKCYDERIENDIVNYLRFVG